MISDLFPGFERSIWTEDKDLIKPKYLKNPSNKMHLQPLM
jgi:hypothetical protein